MKKNSKFFRNALWCIFAPLWCTLFAPTAYSQAGITACDKSIQKLKIVQVLPVAVIILFQLIAQLKTVYRQVSIKISSTRNVGGLDQTAFFPISLHLRALTWFNQRCCWIPSLVFRISGQKKHFTFETALL